MNRALALLLPLSLLAAPALAQETCPRCPPGYEEVASSPALLLEAAKQAKDRRQPELTFRTAVLLRTLHPKSEEAVAAWLLACEVFKPTYRIERLADPDGFSATFDATFMFQWLSSFFVDETFPQQQVDALLLDMPRSFFREYTAFAARPFASETVSQWEMTAKEDNGRVKSISATRKPGAKAVRP